ncbi:MAG: guanylate kinase [Chloroflexota bacterium]
MIKGPKKLIALSSPSGGGKSTVVRHVMERYPDLFFSISATTREKRPGETNGIEYYFITREEFERKIQEGEFVEYEEIFGNYYGTLKTEIDKLINAGIKIIFDIDVKGAISIRREYPEESLLIFLQPPDLDTLEQRLRRRHTESEQELQRRLARAKLELQFAKSFDYVVYNFDLEETFKRIDEILAEYLGPPAVSEK